MESKGRTKFLRKYTNLPTLLDLLQKSQLTLLDPKSWDDKNDSHFLSIYREKRHLKTVLATCFSCTSETYHHWRVFSDGPAGVCIVFDRDRLVADLQVHPEISIRTVRYISLRSMRSQRLSVDDLPFLKRYGYEAEAELRAVYSCDAQSLESISIPFLIDSIRSISLSPWMPKALAASTASTIRAINRCSSLKVSRSTLISNEQWKTYGESAT